MVGKFGVFDSLGSAASASFVDNPEAKADQVLAFTDDQYNEAIQTWDRAQTRWVMRYNNGLCVYLIRSYLYKTGHGHERPEESPLTSHTIDNLKPLQLLSSCLDGLAKCAAALHEKQSTVRSDEETRGFPLERAH
ncbi:hypothetical protein F4819DRAFT_510553 [Hypoxylon fuscum]|nr:hypothetical protein F4819DRAFT_510553 [Hypoxylon fuscum]